MRLSAFGTVCLWATTAEPESLVNWPQFRGTDGAGIADSSNLPTRWSATNNVAWTAEVPGRGWSSPIVWGDRVYVTTAVNAGRFKAPSTGIYGNDYAAELKKQGLSDDEVLKRVVARDIELASESEDVSYEALALGESFLGALEARTGKVAWKVSRTANEGRLKSGWATPFVWENGLRTEIVTVGRGVVISYDTEGHELWRLKGITQATPTPVAGCSSWAPAPRARTRVPCSRSGPGPQGTSRRPRTRPGASS